MATPSPSLAPPSATAGISTPTALEATAAAFTGEIAPVSEAQREAMLASGSWREGCPVDISELRVLSLVYWDFDGRRQHGELMVHSDVAEDVVEAFRSLYESRFPIFGMELVDAFGADDEASMLADNTSAYNCRGIPGSSAWSQHAYGRAVDINPFENPEVRNGVVDPAPAARYADRSLQDQGMIHDGDAAVQAFSAIGWSWGGYWDEPKDYQHFSLTGN
jgi:poly-gamma-glutamate synthesis protein (capsule biosynthesis protein)